MLKHRILHDWMPWWVDLSEANGGSSVVGVLALVLAASFFDEESVSIC